MKSYISHVSISCFVLLSTFTAPLGAQITHKLSADIVIYGGNSAAIIAAVQAVKSGKSVLVVSPDKHLGGLSSGGLGFTDTGNKSVIGGLSKEFYHRVFLHYQKPGSWNWEKKEAFGNRGQGTPAIDGVDRTMWIFEPHVAEQIFENLVKEFNIQVLRNEWLNRDDGLEKKNGKIIALKTLSGKVISGKMFIDATYEGDLMAAAGVKYFIGREPNSQYGEKHNGVQARAEHRGHYFAEKISPYKISGDPNSGLLPRISSKPPGREGEGDARLQAYCYRMCLTNTPENRVPFPRPQGYDSTQYELLLRLLDTGWREGMKKFDAIPNKKTDTNNHGPFSTDNIGMNYDYPEASYERRQEIFREHETYQKGLMYFLANDSRVPADVRKLFGAWGLAKDEFKANGNWPHQLYIREARRMLGQEVMTEPHITGDKEVRNSVGMGSYTLDSHNTIRYVTDEGFVQNEGDVQSPLKKPYSISYGAIIPKKGECENLLVPVCLSSSHIAYGSIRMEPVFMILGQSAATAAALAIDKNIAVQDVSYPELMEILIKDKQRLE